MTDILIAPPAPTATTVPALPAPAAPMDWKRRLVRFGTLGVIIAGLAIAAAVLPLREIGDAIRMLGDAAPVAMAVLGGLLLSVMVPRTAITIACGALLGATTGAITALAAAVIAATCTYYAGRWAGRGVLHARAGGRLRPPRRLAQPPRPLRGAAGAFPPAGPLRPGRLRLRNHHGLPQALPARHHPGRPSRRP